MTNEELLDKIKAEIEKRIKECEATYPKDKDGYWFPEQEEAHAIAGEYKQLLSFLSALEEQAKGYDESYIQSKIAKASETWKGVDVDEYLSQVRGEVHNPIFDECVANVDQKVRKEVRENIDFEQALYDHFGQVKDFTLGMRIAKYFYELGCTRTAEKYDEIEYNRQREQPPLPADLQEYASRAGFDYVDDIEVEHPGHRWNDHDVEYAYRDGIIAGAKWQKGQNDKDLSEKIAAAYQLGLADKEKQMMKEAVEEVEVSMHGEPIEIILDKYVQRAMGIFPGDKVRIIVCKNED